MTATKIPEPTEQRTRRSAEPADAPPTKRATISLETLAVGAVFIALFAFLAAIFAVALAARAVDESRAASNSGQVGGAPPSGSVAVALTEFAISPAEISVPAGGRLAVSNDGNIEHNLGLEATPTVATPMLASGRSADLDVSSLAPGRYVVICEVPGHEAAGMKATLVVT